MKLSIILICHNRPEQAQKAIISIFSQSDFLFNFFVSDNSTNNKLEELMKIEFPTIFYTHRQPVLQPLAHFNACIAEADGDYFCLFHDDDIMHPNFVSEMKKMIGLYPDAIAIGCNASIEKFGELLEEPSFHSIYEHSLIINPNDLARYYFSRSQSGIAPFPSYIYNKKLINQERIPSSGGKYADVTWLLNLTKHGYIVWTRQSLMTYRLHESNDGNIESRADRLTFLAYLKSNRNYISQAILNDYRCSFIYKKIINEKNLIYKKRLELATTFVRHYRWARYLHWSNYVALIKRGIIKIKGRQ